MGKEYKDLVIDGESKAIIDGYVDLLINSRIKIIGGWVSKELRNSCTPPIRGKITKEKLRKRGVCRIYTPYGMYFAQGEKRISPIFKNGQDELGIARRMKNKTK